MDNDGHGDGYVDGDRGGDEKEDLVTGVCHKRVTYCGKMRWMRRKLWMG